MNILILGSGGREHALAWKIAQSSKVSHLYIAPGNAGTSEAGTNIDIPAEDFEKVKSACLQNNIDMLIVGPEAPLVDGIHDYFLQDEELKKIAVIGPRKDAAMLEGSKDFAKQFMHKHSIPTAAYKTFTAAQTDEALAYLESIAPPYVLKADGLAAGKGVLILNNLQEARSEIKQMLMYSKFGKASAKMVVEEFLSGIELSVFVLTDGKSYKILPEAKDYKRIGEGDTGLNTGGMGSISPVPFADNVFMDKVEQRIIKPTVEGLQADGLDYKGFIFFGLINKGGDPYVIEYNARMGDPEAESVIPRIKSDIVDLFQGIAEGNLESKEIEIEEKHAASVFLVSGGYPGSYEKGKKISGLENTTDCLTFHAGTKRNEENEVITAGGRVIAVSALASDTEQALKTAYQNAEVIEFDKKYYRRDLGSDLKAL